MGMYDYLRCDRPLEGGRILEGQDWQTKDGPCELSLLVITSEGRLMVKEEHTEIIDVNYHGEVRFYSLGEEYSALFVDGTCVHLSQRGKREKESQVRVRW